VRTFANMYERDGETILESKAKNQEKKREEAKVRAFNLLQRRGKRFEAVRTQDRRQGAKESQWRAKKREVKNRNSS